MTCPVCGVDKELDVWDVWDDVECECGNTGEWDYTLDEEFNEWPFFTWDNKGNGETE